MLDRYLTRIFAKEKISGNNLGLLFLIKMPLYIIGFRVSDKQKKYEIKKSIVRVPVCFDIQKYRP